MNLQHAQKKIQNKTRTQSNAFVDELPFRRIKTKSHECVPKHQTERRKKKIIICFRFQKIN